MSHPTPWVFVLLALAAYRVWRIAARDSITEKARVAVTGYDDEHAPPLEPDTRSSRRYLSALIRCPWCLGWWISWAAWGLWMLWPTAAVAVATPLALSATLGLIKKNLDRDE